ncbi:MAG: DegQ family serine endoprotease [Pseudomonadota bacterium]
MLIRKLWPILTIIGLMTLYRNVAAELPDFTGLVEKYGTVVVNISTTQKQADVAQPDLPEGIQIPEGTPLDELFRHFFGEQGRRLIPRESKSLGSGFIISADGYILTNRHVVADADEIIVRLQDRRELEAKLIGSDKRSDIALLKVKAEKLPAVKIGSAQALKVGEWVLAIGSPFGFDHSVTAGIVSAKGRSLPSDNYVPFIQTDVAINPGNSGGPLFNMAGEVVGINSQIYSRTGGFMGLSFAIPMDVAMNVVDQIKRHGQVSRGWLGVQVQDVTRELAESFGMRIARGALISRVLPGSPAEKAGFQIGDVIIEFNGQNVETSAELPPLVGMTPVGKATRIKIIRQGEQRTLTVKIGLLPDDEETRLALSKSDTVSVKRLGITVSDLTAQHREQYQVVKHGVLVQRVKAGPASDGGIQRGDVILRLHNQMVENVEGFKKIVETLPAGKAVAVLVQRRGSPVFLAIKIK